MRRAEPCTRSATLSGAARLTFAGDRRVVARSGSGDRLVPLLEAVHECLAGRWIDCLGWEAFIQRWDRPKTLFCLDPPDWGTEHHFGRGLFEQSDFERLSTALQHLQGRFILSLNDVPELRELFAWASIETVERSYQAGGAQHTKRVREVIIS